jgi:hypothetical protein
MVWNIDFRVEPSADPSVNRGTFYLAAYAGDDRLNSTGSSRLPFPVPPKEWPDWDKEMANWPPRRGSSKWEKIIASPEGEVLCIQACRSSVRKFSIGSGTTATPA